MISAALIVRDAERTVADAIRSLRGVVDEVVVLDTGSRDGTLAAIDALAQSWATPEDATGLTDDPPPAIYVHGDWLWRDDFATARNEAASRCSHDWIVVLDADEVLVPGDLRERILAAPDDVDGVAALVICEPPDNAPPDRFIAKRAYRRSRGRWVYPVHNQLVGLRRIARSTAVVRSSYRDGLDKRMARSVPLLERMYAANPKDRHAPTFLALMYAAAQDLPAAARWARIAVDLTRAEEPHPGHALAWAVLVRATIAVQGLGAASAVLAEALGRYPQAPDLWHAGATLYAMQWVNATARARGTEWEIGSMQPITEGDRSRLQEAFDSLGMGLSLSAPAEGQSQPHGKQTNAPHSPHESIQSASQ